MKRDGRIRYCPRRPLFERQDSRGSVGTGSTSSTTGTSASSNSSIGNTSGSGILDLDSTSLYGASGANAPFLGVLHSDVVVPSFNDRSDNDVDINDFNELLCVLQDLV